jgi:geranylgeranyl pyrophosphate synthase
MACHMNMNRRWLTRLNDIVSLLMHKTLNVITKTVANEESKKIAEDYLDKTLEYVEDVLRATKADHLEIIDIRKGMIPLCSIHYHFLLTS